MMEPICECGKRASELDEMWATILMPTGMDGSAFCIECMAIMKMLLRNYIRARNS